jgi:hypothetical protein
MTCDYFRRVWEITERPRAELLLNYEYGPLRIGRPKFVRFDEFVKREPSSSRPCRCGGPDAWRCWHRTKQDELLGEGRRSSTHG